MPSQRPPIHAHPSKPFRTWEDVARDNQIVVICCGLCRRCQNFLPEDLAKVFGPRQPAHIPPFACSRCGTGEYMRLVHHVPTAQEAMSLEVRRPVKPVKKWVWRTMRLGR
jgi:hypothetical protein